MTKTRLSTTSTRLLAAAAATAALAACTTARVVEYPSGRAPSTATRTASPMPPASQGATTTERISTPKYGATYEVQKGDTVYHIATTNGITPLDLALWNDIPPPYIIHPGQRVRLYPRNGKAPPPPPSTTAVIVPVPRPAAPSSSSVPTPPPAATTRPTAGNLAWRWPADGQVISTYLAGEPTRQGLDIAGSAGQPVRAASDGVVVYSGAGLVGYGELIIIKHNSEWLSAYGHNRKRMVTEGQRVAAGQQIAEMGRTAAPRDMLHFEIRFDGKPVDPQLYLPKK
ncbi:MAG: peptidoglycan DD-metalloendopeptidase family protein [Xanthomonadales bacterium]|nr:peptidoglycan DD-metalloendopeptidase family protein [Xanthomonadales bacterium]